MRKIPFRYGKRTIEFDPVSLGSHRILLPESRKPDRTEEEIIRESLANPAGSPSLPALLRQKRPSRITVVLSDITRVTGSPVFLPILLNLFEQAKIPPGRLTFLIASGIHAPCGRRQVESLLGLPASVPLRLEEVRPPYAYRLSSGSRVVLHNARDEKNLRTLGRFSDGSRFRIHKRAAESDFLILTGALTPHYLAGFGGGRKAILPGISSYENCVDLHKLSLCRKRDRKSARVSLGRLKGNPFHQRMEEAAQKVRPAFMLNTICDDRKRIVYAVSGNWQKAFTRGVRFLQRNFIVKPSGLFDAAIVSCGGFPKDINFIQSHKSLENTLGLVREEGALLLVAECREQLGNPCFLKWFQFSSERKFVRGLKKDFVINGQTALATFKKCERVRTYMLTSLPRSVLSRMNIRKAASLEEFAEREGLAAKKVVLVPSGSTTWVRRS